MIPFSYAYADVYHASSCRQLPLAEPASPLLAAVGHCGGYLIDGSIPA
jgi:hypothetical protein